MKIFNIETMTGGWFIGNFSPSIFKTKNFEVGIHEYKKGYVSPDKGHYHKIATEINYISYGKIQIDQKILSKGDIFMYEPYEKSYVTFLEDTQLFIIKIPSVPGDKYI